MAGLTKVAVCALAATSVQGLKLGSTSAMTRANPIRRVVTALQKIEKKVTKEGEEATELHETFMCACKTQTNDYTQSISDGEAKSGQLSANLESTTDLKAQLESDLKGHKSDREAAKMALADAKALREKEAAAFAATKAEYETNIAAMTKAVAAIEAGGGNSFLQTDGAQKLRDIVNSAQSMGGDSREEILAFLSNSEESGASGEIVGILKQLGDEMAKDLADATKVEDGAIADYNGLVASKNDEVATLTTAIEDKITRIGESGLKIEDLKADSKDTAEKIVADKKFLADLKVECADKEKAWDAESKERQAELLAIAETITMLNSDEALELFKKTLPSSASLLQLTDRASAVKARALEMIHNAQKSARPMQHLDMIALALHGRTSDFSKVIGMIDEMVSVLKSEQKDDNEKKDYCNHEIDATEDKIKILVQQGKDAEAAIADAKETVATLESEIAALEAGLKELDESVDSATTQRKKENTAWKELQASNTAAMDLIEMAKNRLQKFYNPKLAKFLQVQKSGEAATGVMAMMDSLVAELEKETTVAEANEKDAQSDYEKFMADSKAMRIENSKLVEDKTAAKADAIGATETHEENLGVAQKKNKGAEDQLGVLHQDCDWLLSNFDSRKEARADEIESLKKAKAVLSGADA
jgi:chromosome segregation ATPase